MPQPATIQFTLHGDYTPQSFLHQYRTLLVPPAGAPPAQHYYLEFVLAFRSQLEDWIPQYAAVIDDVAVHPRPCEEMGVWIFSVLLWELIG
jgi:hypothetical protein